MARDAITPLELVRGTINNAASPTAINTTNGMIIPYKEQDKLFLVINNTTISAKNVTVKASTSIKSFMKGQGNLAIAIPASTIGYLIGIEQARFKELTQGASFGKILIDFETGMTGFITAIVVP